MVMIVVLSKPVISKASVSSDVTKILKYYKTEKYNKAAKIAKKYTGTVADEKTYRKMLSAKEKKAFIKIIKSYSISESPFNEEGFLWNYFVKDLDGNGKPELCIHFGHAEVDARLRVYGLKKNKAKLIGEIGCNYAAFYDIPGKNGIIYRYGKSMFEDVYKIIVKKNRIIRKRIGGHHLYDYDNYKLLYNWMVFPFKFPEHIVRDTEHGVEYLSLGGVKKSGKIYPS